MQCNLFPNGVLVGVVVIVKCLALSVETVFVTCLFRSVWPSPEYNTKLKDGVTPSQSVLRLAGAGGNAQNSSQRPSMSWHLKKGKA